MKHPPQSLGPDDLDCLFGYSESMDFDPFVSFFAKTERFDSFVAKTERFDQVSLLL